jgi:hypothetical protein
MSLLESDAPVVYRTELFLLDCPRCFYLILIAVMFLMGFALRRLCLCLFSMQRKWQKGSLCLLKRQFCKTLPENVRGVVDEMVGFLIIFPVLCFDL